MLGDEIASGFRGTKENDLLKAQNRSNFPWMPEYNDFDSNVNINMPADTYSYCYSYSDTISDTSKASDSDIGFVAMGPLAIKMLVTFVTIASNVVISIFDGAYAHSTFLVIIVFLILAKGSRAMDPEDTRMAGDSNAAAAGIGIGLALVAGAIVHCGTKTEETRKRKVRSPLDVAGGTAMKGDAPDLAANSDSDDDDDGAVVGERHSNMRGLLAEAGLQHDAHVIVPVPAVPSERDHALSSHPSPFHRCATCHRKSTCNPVNCELHLGSSKKVRMCRRRLFHNNYIAASPIASVHLQARIARESRDIKRKKANDN